MTFKKLSTETVLDIGFFKVSKSFILEEDTNTKFDRHMVEHIGASLVVPIMSNGDVVLIKQYRHTVDSEIAEAVAGKFDAPDEDPMLCAKRELLEEVGVKSENLIPVGVWYVTPGYTNEINHAFLALDCEEPIAPTPDGIEEQHSEILRMPLNDALEMTKDGSIKDIKSILLIQRAAEYISKN